MGSLHLPEGQVLSLHAVDFAVIVVGEKEWRGLLAPPGDGGLWHSSGTAGQRYILSGGADHILASLVVDNIRRHHHVQVAHLAFHGICVDLAHVPKDVGIVSYLKDINNLNIIIKDAPSAIRLLNIPNFQLPDAVLCVRDGNAVVLGDDMVLDAQNGLSVHSQPGHFEANQVVDNTGQQGISSHGNRRVVDGTAELGIRWKEDSTKTQLVDIYGYPHYGTKWGRHREREEGGPWCGL